MKHIQTQVDLKPYNTFGISSIAARFAEFEDNQSLVELLQAHAAHPSSLLVLGGGSNVLFRDNYAGLVLRNRMRGIEITEQDEHTVLVKAGAGETWDDLVADTVNNGWGGLENLSLIPGCVGASPMQNIGAYGAEIKDTCEKVFATEISTGKQVEFSKAECRFGYRDSIFKQEARNKYVITAVSFRLSKKPRINASYGNLEKELDNMKVVQPGIADIRRAVIAVRRSKLPDPAVLGNAGSFFKNPVVKEDLAEKILAAHAGVPVFDAEPGMKKLAAGWLIEACGLKGYREGDAGVHSLQALVLVNYGKATGNDIYALSGHIIRRVYETFGVELEREVNIIG